MTQLIEQSKARCRNNQRLLADSRRLMAISRRELNPYFGISGSSDEAAGAPPARWADALRGLVRHKLAVGDLFALIDTHCWSGPATGDSCVVCGEKIDGGIEFEIDGPAGSVFTHLVCYSLWHGESEDFLPSYGGPGEAKSFWQEVIRDPSRLLADSHFADYGGADAHRSPRDAVSLRDKPPLCWARR